MSQHRRGSGEKVKIHEGEVHEFDRSTIKHGDIIVTGNGYRGEGMYIVRCHGSSFSCVQSIDDGGYLQIPFDMTKYI